jgi:hypothetical protein
VKLPPNMADVVPEFVSLIYIAPIASCKFCKVSPPGDPGRNRELTVTKTTFANDRPSHPHRLMS